MAKKIEENTMKELLSVINNKKIQNMMCNKDVLNSLGEKPNMNQLMDCQDLHNVISDRDLMSKIFDLSKAMGSSSSENNFPVSNKQKSIEEDISTTDYKKYTYHKESNETETQLKKNKELKPEVTTNLNIDKNEEYYNELIKLGKMGHNDLIKNNELLKKHNGNIVAVLKELL